MSTPTSLFDPSLITHTHSLPTGYTFRPLQRNDFKNGHLKPLQDLAYIGTITEQQWTSRFDYMKSCPDTYFIVVILHDDRIVGTGTLLVERKFLFELGLQGHIEDIAIAKGYQGKGLGKVLLDTLNGVAKNVGCYKTILDCSTENTGFYERCSYELAGQEMHQYLDDRAREHSV